MQTWMAFAIGVALGAVATFVVARASFAARTAAAEAQVGLLRERIVDLEASLSEDAETAAALAPLREALGRVERQVGVLERDRVEQFGALRTVMTRVEHETQALGAQTKSLAGSLNASTVRGAWGEVQLRRVLEHAGMIARCDFDEQVGGVSRHDRGVRPDVVVRLPGGKVLVVDAKAPMTAFLHAQGEDVDDSERATLMREHARALSGHVRALTDKAYWTAFETTPEMVVCFVPTEAMLSSALSADPALLESAMAKKVVLVGPASLLALARTVAYTWQQDALSTNARELFTLGRELHERLATLGAHVARMGGQLQRTVESYNQMVGALESRVLVSARKMSDLGLTATPLETVTPLETGPRVLTALELLDAVSEQDRRPEIVAEQASPQPAKDVG